jgi:hypothetical protein
MADGIQAYFSNLTQDPLFNFGLQMMAQGTPQGSLANALQGFQGWQQGQQARTMQQLQAERWKSEQEKQRKQEELAAKIPELLAKYQRPAVPATPAQTTYGPMLGNDAPLMGGLAGALQGGFNNAPMMGAQQPINIPAQPAQPAGFDMQGFQQEAMPIQAQLDPMGTMQNLLKQQQEAAEKQRKAQEWETYRNSLPPEIRDNPAAMAVFNAPADFAGKIAPGVLPSALKPKETKPVEYTKGREKFKIIPDMSPEQAQALGLQYIRGVGAIARGEMDKPQSITIRNGSRGGNKISNIDEKSIAKSYEASEAANEAKYILDNAKQLYGKYASGRYEQVFGPASRWGVGNKEKAADYEQAVQIQNDLGSLKLQRFGGSDTERELLVAISTSPSPDKLPETNMAIIANQINAIDVLQHLPDFKVQWIEENGSLSKRNAEGKAFGEAWKAYQKANFKQVKVPTGKEAPKETKKPTDVRGGTSKPTQPIKFLGFEE